MLFGNRLPKGQYAVALYASVGTPDPGLVPDLLLEEHPVEGEQVRRATTRRWTNSAADRLAVDGRRHRRSTTRARIAAARSRVRRRWPTYVASIPLFQTPTIFIYDKDRLGGTLQDNTVMGPFFTMNEWTLK